jgi:hypothetical protein
MSAAAAQPLVRTMRPALLPIHFETVPGLQGGYGIRITCTTNTTE